MSENLGASPRGTTSLCPGADTGRGGRLTCIPGGGRSGLSLEHLHRSTWKNPEGEGGLPGGLRELEGIHLGHTQCWCPLAAGPP